MSRTTKGSKGPGYDYWSRRHPSNIFMSPGKFSKKLTHKYERRKAKKHIRAVSSDR